VALPLLPEGEEPALGGLPGHSARGRRPTYSEVVQAAEAAGAFRDVALGHDFGPSWSTHWVRVECVVPEAWRGGAGVHFVFDANCEAAVYNDAGTLLQGLTGGDALTYRGNRRVEVVLAPGDVTAEGRLLLYVEVACNGLFGCGADGMINPPDPARTFSLAAAGVARVCAAGTAMFWDFVGLRDLVEAAPPGSLVAERSLMVANAMLNTVRRHDTASYAAASRLADEVLRPATEGGAASRLGEEVHCVGHCHIDSAWLWPFAETERKVARSWVSQLRYMGAGGTGGGSGGGFTFVASQAAQYAWLVARHPDALPALRTAIADGRFVPVGGAWVEPDANVPSGEALVRQFLYGTGYLARAFGDVIAAAASRRAAAAGAAPPVRIPHGDDVFWLPDTFGYNAQLPQLIRGCGMHYFLTQKLSWSLLNKVIRDCGGAR